MSPATLKVGFGVDALSFLEGLDLALFRVEEAASKLDQIRRRDRSLAPIQAAFEPQVSAFFREQGRLFLRATEQAKRRERAQEAARLYESDRQDAEEQPQNQPPLLTDAQIDAILDDASAGINVQLAAQADAAIRDAYTAGAQNAFETVGAENLPFALSFDLQNPVAQVYLQNHAAELVKGINDTTRSEIAGIVTRGQLAGTNYNEIAAQISERFAQFAVGKPQQHIDSRAHLVAITELGNAFETAKADASNEMAAFGLAMEDAWQTVGDDRVSEGCRENQAAGWIAHGTPFPSGHYHPLRHPGCRCSSLSRRNPKGLSERPTLSREIALIDKLASGQLGPDDFDFLKDPGSYRASSLAQNERLYRDRTPGESVTDVAMRQPPIRLEYDEQSKRLVLTDGRHRLLAAQLAGAESFPVELRYFDARLDEVSRARVLLGLPKRTADQERELQALARAIVRG